MTTQTQEANSSQEITRYDSHESTWLRRAGGVLRPLVGVALLVALTLGMLMQFAAVTRETEPIREQVVQPDGRRHTPTVQRLIVMPPLTVIAAAPLRCS